MKKVILLDPLSYLNNSFGHSHFVRDWSGSRLPADVYLPPLDLMFAAAYLRQHGYLVKIIEASAKHMAHAKVAKIVEQENPDFVLIPTVSFDMESDKRLAYLIRESSPKVKLIFSGPLVTFDPAGVLLDKTADFVIIGELEMPLLDIVKGNCAENVAYLDNQGAVIIGRRSLLDLNELPLPARDLIDNQIYNYAVFNKRNPITAMILSRGCPHSRCEFCHTNLYTLGQIRYRNLQAITDEIQELVFKYKIGEVFFRDQCFTANRELILKLCDFLISNKINLVWRAETRVDLVDKELLALMNRAGCYQLSFGFESSSQTSLDLNNKGIRLEQSRQAAQLAKQAGIEVVGLFLYGMLGDTKESMAGLVNFALGLNVDYANFEPIHFMPGTPVYEKMVKGRESIFFTKEVLKIHVKNAYLKFYFRPAFMYKHLVRIIRSGSFRQIQVALKVVLSAFLFFLSLDSSSFGMSSRKK